ncbi:MAG: hypothetical protein KC503_09180 [Myxococcales bacterium]|nr:hypothetical protein [Myxococcales bacterium]
MTKPLRAPLGRRLMLTFALLTTACAGSTITNGYVPGQPDSTGDTQPGLPDLGVPSYDSGGSSSSSLPEVVYAHTDTALYKVDPNTLQVAKLADFLWPAGADQMTDIAIDAQGKMIGVSATTVYAVDTKTGACTQLATIGKNMVGLSFVKPDNGGAEYLLGIDASEGGVHRIDPNSGLTTLVGHLGNGWLASGDIVSVAGFGTVATLIRDDFSGNDWLARIDPNTGAATPIGDTGVQQVYGLGYWKGKLYGFTATSQFVLIDVNTGRSALVSQNNPSWWGSGVTTVAPVIQ